MYHVRTIVTGIFRKQEIGSIVGTAGTAVGQYVTAAVLNYTLFMYIIHYLLLTASTNSRASFV